VCGVTHTPPGWYPDGHGNTRWWDGQGWAAPGSVSATPTPVKLARMPLRNKVFIAAVVAAAAVLVLVFAPFGTDNFNVYGSLQLNGSDGISHSGTVCQGTDGYDDIQVGAEVVVSDDSGKTLAIGDLTTSTYDGSCSFTFAVKGVPTGKKFYGVEVTHRGDVQFTEQQLKAGPTLTLG
jgi:hypothetical protein